MTGLAQCAVGLLHQIQVHTKNCLLKRLKNTVSYISDFKASID